MEKKNMVLLTVIAVATLLVAVVGATFAYFTATITDNRDGDGNEGQAAITAAKTPGSLIIEKSDTGFSSFNETDVYPGHKELIQLKVTSNEDNINDTFFNIVYEGTTNFPDNMIEFDIYESKEGISGDVSKAFTCNKHSDLIESGPNYKLYEDCQLDSSLSTGLGQAHLLKNTVLKQSDSKLILNGEHPFVITGSAETKTMYYYVVVKYKNESTDQSATDQGKTLNGKITIEIAASDSNAINDTDDNNLSKKGV